MIFTFIALRTTVDTFRDIMPATHEFFVLAKALKPKLGDARLIVPAATLQNGLTYV